MKPHFRVDFVFPRNYEVKILASAPLAHPAEKLYHYPTELEEHDRTGAYLRVAPRDGVTWAGFFALGFESDQVISAVCSCPDADSLCVVVGGYAYVVKTTDPTEWLRIEQRPVIEMRTLPEQGLLLFTGFTTISALGRTGLAWITERLSWEGISITEISGQTLRGVGWDALTDMQVPFEVDLQTGRHTGGTRPGDQPGTSRKT
jgi:hypothetical protein